MRHSWFVSIAGALLSLPALATSLLAQVATPTLLSYQGVLTDAGGSAITAATPAQFTILWGGTATEPTSTGMPVYQENVTLIPDARGVFHHLIGSGAPTSACDENRDGTAAEACVLSADDFPGGGTVVYLELRLDPAGANNPLLPRQQLVSTAYAFNSSLLGGKPQSDFITGVSAGSGLTGGGSSGDVTLAIAPSGVNFSHLAVDSVGPLQIQMNSVSGPELIDLGVGSADLANGAVISGKIGTGAVNSTAILDNSVTAVDLAPDSVGASEIQANGVGTSELATASVTSAKLAPLSSVPFADGSVQSTAAFTRVSFPSVSVSLAPLTSEVRIITCPSGSVAISGSWEQTQATNSRLVWAWESYRTSDGTGWGFGIRNDTSSTTLSLTISAVCLGR